MKKRMLIAVLLVLVLSSILVQAEDPNDCSFFCQIGEWWNSFTGENVAGKVGEQRIALNNPEDQKFYETRLGKTSEAVYAFSS